MAGRRPLQCVLDRPTKDSVRLGNLYICLSAIARDQQIGWGHLHRIINGEKEGTMRVYVKIASAIGFSIEELLEAIEERKKLRLAHADAVIGSYNDRVRREEAADRNRRAQGKPVKPRLPGLRVK